jgi:ABC-type transport system substrate-binding protein
MRRKALAFVMLFGLLAAACGGGSDTSDTAGGQAAAQPDLNAEIRVAANEDQWTEGGTGAKSYHFMYVYNVQVYEPLIYLGSDYTLKPGLAERWELQPDGKTWRFFLRQNVKFHDGSAFSADDVVWTWDVRQHEGKTLTTVLNTLAPGSVKKIDQFTVDFTPVTTNLRLPEQIVHPEGAIVKANTHNDTPPYAGTGPWKYESYTPKQTASFVRNDDYWGQKPQLRKMNIRFYPDPQTRLEALKSGQADIAIDLPADATKSLSNDPNFKVVKSKAGRNHLLYVNKLEGRLTSEAAVREAVTYAIDRQSYVDVVLDGNAAPGRYMAPASVLGSAANQVAPIPRDLARSRKVLDDAGWRPGADGIRSKDGKRLTLKLLGQQEVPESALLVIQSNLKDVGIDVEIKKTPDVATRNSLYAQGKGDFDLDLEPPNQNDGNPAFLPVLRMAKRSATNVQFAPDAPPATPNGPAFEAEVTRSDQAKTVPEVQDAAAKMMNILINKDYLVVPLADAFRIYGMAKNVNLGDPHPSFTNQTWFSLSMTPAK